MNKVARPFVPDGGVTMDLGTPHCHWVNQRFQGGGGGRYHGCLASQWLGQHRLIIFYSTLCVARHAAYVTRPWNYNYWTSAAYILENSSFARHRSLNANKAVLSLRYMSPFPRLRSPASCRINNNWANRTYSVRFLIHFLYSFIDQFRNLRLKVEENFNVNTKNN